MGNNPESAAYERGRQLSVWLFLYAFAYAFMHILPVFLKHDLKNHLTSGDLLALFTPIIVLPLAWRLYLILRANVTATDEGKMQLATGILFVASIFFAHGQGMNLSANAIARHLGGTEDTPLYWLNYFFDETVGHIFWHAGVLGISLSLLLIATNLRARRANWMALAGTPFFGFTYFTDAVEGQTVFLLLPGAILICAAILFWTQRRKSLILNNPVMLFYLLAFAVAIVLFIVWWIIQGGFPQFSEVGWI